MPPGTTCWGGLDLASTRDLTALALVAPRTTCELPGHAGKCIELRCHFWLPKDGMRERVQRDHVPYDTWADQGWIRLTPGNVTDYDRIRADLHEIADGITIRAIGHDRWNATQLVSQLGSDGFDLVPVGQGYASLTAPAKAIEGQVAAGLVHHDGNPVLAWMVRNVVAEIDAAGNIKPSRDKSADKIDGVAAWCDAVFAMTAAPVEPPFVSVYEERGLLWLDYR